MRVVTSIAVALALGSTFVAAQATKATPGPEHKRMAYFAGQWNYQGEAKNSPLGPGGKIAGTEGKPTSTLGVHEPAGWGRWRARS